MFRTIAAMIWNDEATMTCNAQNWSLLGSEFDRCGKAAGRRTGKVDRGTALRSQSLDDRETQSCTASRSVA